MSAQHLLLFDVDGVLIEDGGYYAALIATLNYFNELLGAAPIDFWRCPIAINSSRAATSTNGICARCAPESSSSRRWPAIPIWRCALPRSKISCANSVASVCRS